MTKEQILEGIIEEMENCHAECSCSECPIKFYCDEWEKLLYERKTK